MGWFRKGYEHVDTAYNDAPKSQRQGGPKRVYIRPGETREFLFLEDDPLLYWEHKYFHNGNWFNYEACRFKNGMSQHEDECKLCVRYPDSYPYFIGLHTVISLTEWTSEKGNIFCYGRQIYAAKLGGKDKPATLKRLRRIQQREGRLRGLVISCHRMGEKSDTVGDELEVIERLEPTQEAIDAFLKPKIAEYLKRVNERITDPQKQLTLEKHLKRDPLTAFNFEEIQKPISEEELARRLRFSSKGGEKGGGEGNGNEGNGESSVDEDVPY